jgi:hypothetical protein
MADPGQPRRRLGRQPLGDGGSAASRQDVDETPPSRSMIPVTSRRGARRWRRGTRSHPTRPRSARRGGPGDRPGVGRGRTPPPSLHARTPRSPGPPGRPSAPRAHPAGDLGAGPLGQHGPRGDLVGLLGPRTGQARRLRAAPQSLGPHLHHRPIRQGQVPDHHPATTVPDRLHTTGPAPRPVLGAMREGTRTGLRTTARSTPPRRRSPWPMSMELSWTAGQGSPVGPPGHG